MFTKYGENFTFTFSWFDIKFAYFIYRKLLRQRTSMMHAGLFTADLRELIIVSQHHCMLQEFVLKSVTVRRWIMLSEHNEICQIASFSLMMVYFMPLEIIKKNTFVIYSVSHLKWPE